MTLRVALHHRIDRRFSRHVHLSTHWLRLRPAPHCRCEVEAYSLHVNTNPHFINWLRDPFENHLARLDFPEPIKQLSLEMEMLLEIESVNPFDFLLDTDASAYPVRYSEQQRKELAPYLRHAPPQRHTQAWLEQLPRPKGPLVAFLGTLNQHFNELIAWDGSWTPGPVDCELLLQRQSGSAWEMAWLATLSLRALGLAARFTSGYKLLLAGDDTQANVAARHAWTEVFLPGAGWIGLDPTSGIYTTHSHIPLASCPDPLRAIDLHGYREACDEEASDQVEIRVLQPQAHALCDTRSMPHALRALGNKVDGMLARSSIDLATAAELAFVSCVNDSAPEWTTMALGTDKRHAANALATGLTQRLACGALYHEGQGEWYSGEDFPRWRLSCLFRIDGKPIWHDPTLLSPGREQNERSTGTHARNFALALAGKLKLPPDYVLPAFEDGLYEQWKNQSLSDFEPAADDLNDPLRRRALAQRLCAVSGDPVGFVIPLRWDYVESCWISGQWRFRRNALYLTPGDSPMGYRLPLDSLAMSESDRAEPHLERSPFEQRPADPAMHGETSARHSSFASPTPAPEFADALAVHPAPRTALCVQLRSGRIHVFIPPLSHLEHYLALIAATNDVARSMGAAVTLEGYEPAQDHRLQRIVFEPDNGILRVLLPQCHAFERQYELISICYEEAEKLGLRGERRLSDGSAAVPAGGVSITLCANEPAQSPFLRQPQLLRKLIAYWQRHPSLSYFFADRAIGPGGIAPRPDEGRDDALYELGIALARIPDGHSDHPWIADRLLRHLLADPTGNVHRAEINIDHLYPPQRQSERLGRVKLRCFEMQPNPPYAAAQTLLVKGLVAMFSQSTTTSTLKSWGLSLHDRYMLPHMLWQDMSEIIHELNDAGLAFQDRWFLHMLDASLPVIGTVQLGDIRLRLRLAREPWPLLAEEIVGGNIARFVDSSTQRIEVLVTGLIPDRYALACNDRRVPLQPTPVKGEYVAGVRFKAWNPPSSLHPTRPAARVLGFDLIDTWRGRSVGGCSYYPNPPDIWGSVSPSRQTKQAEPQLRVTPTRSLHSVSAWATRGRFVRRDARAETVTAPAAGANAQQPYLLDLTR